MYFTLNPSSELISILSYHYKHSNKFIQIIQSAEPFDFILPLSSFLKMLT